MTHQNFLEKWIRVIPEERREEFDLNLEALLEDVRLTERTDRVVY